MSPMHQQACRVFKGVQLSADEPEKSGLRLALISPLALLSMLCLLSFCAQQTEIELLQQELLLAHSSSCISLDGALK